MNRKAIEILEFHKIITMLAEYATSEPGRRACMELLPSSSLSEAESMQEETSAALARLLRGATPNFGNVKPLQEPLKRLELGGVLNQSELLQAAALLENTARIKAYGRHDREDTPLDCLDPMFQALEPLHPLVGKIRSALLSETEVSSDASPELKQIRRSIRSNEDRIRTQLSEMMNGSFRTYLQDAVVTMRDGRFCLPIKAEYRSKVSGMIHDQSSTGSTLFIEPMAIVRLNNDIRTLEIKEAREIEKILARLSEETAPYTEQIRQNLSTMTTLDFIFARGQLALKMNATRPIFNSDRNIHLRKARHPLIDPKSVVPIDIRLGREFDLLIVTGPNTGGKTVSLKTIGLLTLMGQAGLHIPTADRSELGLFHEVYADIGDEQSIEQSLSTFSSHMTNTVSFLEKADENSLVLFDELGAGTDPTEGAALAISILSFLHHQGIRTMATTHYSELKIYALQTEGVENASCEFDVSSLRPTYRLLIGVPGKSNAFAISSRLGLPEYIIESAKEQLSRQDVAFEDILTGLEQRRVTLEAQQEDLDRKQNEIEQRLKELTDRQEKLSDSRDKIIRKANEEARQLLQEAKEYADRTMKDFRKFGKQGINAAQMEQHRQELRKRMDQADKHLTVKPAKRASRELKPNELKPGTSVKVLSLNLKGIVSTRPDSRGNLFVQCGIIRSKVNLKDLELIEEPVNASAKLGRTSSGTIKVNKSMHASSEINLLGKTVDEATAALDKFIDDAYIAHLHTLRVIHGKGTGALRKGVHEYLRSSRQVEEYHLAEFGEGDAGVTIVKLR